MGGNSIACFEIRMIRNFEISKISMAMFKLWILLFFVTFQGKKTDCYFDMYVQNYAYFNLYEQNFSLLQLLHTYKLQSMFITCWYGQKDVLRLKFLQ